MRRFPVAALAVAALLLTALVAPATAATFPPVGEIRGTVTTADTHTPVRTVVYIFRKVHGHWENVPSTWTDPQGRYSSTLKVGTYRIWAEATNWDPDAPRYAAQYFAHQSFLETATPVSVESATTTVRDIQLDPGAQITGHVAGIDPDEPHELTAVASMQNPVTHGWEDFGNSQVDDSGTYTIRGLPSGTFRVRVQDGKGTYLASYYGGSSEPAAATPVSATSASTTTIGDTTPTPAGQIRGTVTTPDGQPLPGVKVLSSRKTALGWGLVATGVTAADGTYAVRGMTTGDYQLTFSPTDKRYPEELYDDTYSPGTATLVPVTTSEVTSGIDATLARASVIKGHITGPRGRGAYDVEVKVWRLQDGKWTLFTGRPTSRHGFYTTGRLPVGQYKLQFDPFPDRPWKAEYYANASSLAKARVINLSTPGTAVTGIDARLARK